MKSDFAPLHYIFSPGDYEVVFKFFLNRFKWIRCWIDKHNSYSHKQKKTAIKVFASIHLNYLLLFVIQNYLSRFLNQPYVSCVYQHLRTFLELANLMCCEANARTKSLHV